MASQQQKKSRLRRFISALLSPSARWSVFAILCLGAVLALVGVIGFEASMAYSSTEEFCSTSCHEMAENPYAAVQKTSHFHNRSGVRPDCAACHIPKPFIPKMIRKIEAAREVWGHFTGIIDTPEKYAAHVPAMKAREIARLKANDSAECRNCHQVEQMLDNLQAPKAREYHQAMERSGKTCIDCHQGIAHSYVQQTSVQQTSAEQTSIEQTAARTSIDDNPQPDAGSEQQTGDDDQSTADAAAPGIDDTQ
jgi:cytochrome c-type protein NapC